MRPSPIFLEGHRIILRPVLPRDAVMLKQWLNDPAVTYYMFYGQRPLTLSQTQELLQKQVQADTNVVLTVEDRRRKRPIGLAGLYDIHPTARKAEFRILLGDRSVWNKGLGTEVTEIMTWYGFDRLNLNRLWLGVTSENEGAVRAYEKSGYKREGVLKQDIYRNSHYYDSVRMAILRKDYYPGLHSRHQKQVKLPLKKVKRKKRP